LFSIKYPYGIALPLTAYDNQIRITLLGWFIWQAESSFNVIKSRIVNEFLIYRPSNVVPLKIFKACHDFLHVLVGRYNATCAVLCTLGLYKDNCLTRPTTQAIRERLNNMRADEGAWSGRI